MTFTIDNFVAHIKSQYQHIVDQENLHDVPFETIIEYIVNYYADIISCLPGNVYWFDKQGIAVGCNQNVLNMFQFKSLTEFKGLTFEEMGKAGGWSEYAIQSFKRDTLEVIMTRKPKLNIEEPPIPHPDGRIIYFLTSRVPLYNQSNEVIGIVGISIDITERKQMELALLKAKAEAEAANQVKLDFIHNMEHDIRTPFNGIYGIAKFLAEQETDLEKKDFLNDIVNCSKELLEYSTGILDFSRIESGSLPISLKKFDLHKLIDGIIAMETPPKLKRLDLLSIYDKDVPTSVLGDRFRLQRILINLISNAIKFTPAGFVHLHVEVGKVLDRRNIALRFSIKDSGIGIPQEKQDLLYERFSRLTPSNQGQYFGHGLGLRIVKQFVEEMDGDIEVESTVGEGTTFICTLIFKLPVTESIINEDDKVQRVELRNGIRVLVVEDHLVAQKIAVTLLKSLNCYVDVAGSAKQTLELLSKNTYHLIFLDIGLPDMDGLELAKEIRKNEQGKKKTPIIVLTAHTEKNYKEKFQELGINDCLAKPLTIEMAQDSLAKWVNFDSESSSSTP